MMKWADEWAFLSLRSYKLAGLLRDAKHSFNFPLCLDWVLSTFCCGFCSLREGCILILMPLSQPEVCLACSIVKYLWNSPQRAVLVDLFSWFLSMDDWSSTLVGDLRSCFSFEKNISSALCVGLRGDYLISSYWSAPPICLSLVLFLQDWFFFPRFFWGSSTNYGDQCICFSYDYIITVLFVECQVLDYLPSSYSSPVVVRDYSIRLLLVH